MVHFWFTFHYTFPPRKRCSKRANLTPPSRQAPRPFPKVLPFPFGSLLVHFWFAFGSLLVHFSLHLPSSQKVLQASKFDTAKPPSAKALSQSPPVPFWFTVGSLLVHCWFTFHCTFPPRKRCATLHFSLHLPSSQKVRHASLFTTPSFLAKGAPREQIRAAKAPSAKVLSQSVPFHLTHGDEPFPFHCTDAPSVCLSLLHYTIIIYFLFIKQKNNNRQRQTDRQTDTRPVISNTERSRNRR